ncbi:Adaptive-response sensory-kinase SasA [Gemmata sp. SH-PL17]|uniref:sensor histidine kinase n=1 Tax=Gemmata sp. SH-PL17 TaxID=1630693 RepID=UPI00078D5C40|nr:sensor histidine kinase [Gemmata sp. SH-PL17]AMV25295.1 Adaptive-response sensory-kinase SasA [Gemmata sp. SH-PL17]
MRRSRSRAGNVIICQLGAARRQGRLQLRLSTRTSGEGPAINNLDQLAALVIRERETLLARWREQVRKLPSARHLDTPTLNDHIPAFFEELAAALRARSDETIQEAVCEGTPPAHGLQRAQDGFDIVEVVAEYNILRECIHDLADANKLPLQGRSFHIVNRVLDGAIGSAVKTYATQKALEVQRRREEYLSFVAHDLRTPLSAISLAASVLEVKHAGEDPNSSSARMVKTLRRNVQHLGALVNKVLEENTNLQTEVGVKLERREFDLWPLVEALVHDIHPVAGTDSTKLINAVPEDLVIYADAELLRRVFQNLIANAIKYTPCGEVVISARRLDADTGFECSVRDNGEGIAPDRIDKVFDHFETDPNKQGGLGLGLAIVKTFVEAHGGRVTVESTVGTGSTFVFTLPAKMNSSS